MNYIEALKENLRVRTENGDTAFSTTGKYTLDFYSLMGGMRNNYSDLSNLFMRSFYEDNILTLKILFHLRDILDGLGERNSFRLTFNMFANLNPEIARKVISLIPKYGRYDDLFAGFNTPIELDVLKYIEKTLDSDLELYNNNKSYSLLSKWLPSINTSNKESRLLARKIAKHLNLTHEEYRKMLSKLRKGKIIENYLREKDYTFDYSNVPSLASLKYFNTFISRDEVRFKEFLENVEKGKASMNTKTANVSSVMYKSVESNDLSDKFLNTYWDNIPRFIAKTNAIVVRDGSGSMTYAPGSTLLPIEVATALSVFFAEQLPEPFKDHFITFSEKPELIKILGNTMTEKRDFLESFNDYTNTNISLVYDLLLNVAESEKVKQEDMVEQVIIISDMEFDEAVSGMSTFELYREKFNKLNLKMPELVFWNVNARDIHFPVLENEYGVKLVSGSSQKILELVTNNDLKALSPYEFMLNVLENYKEVDELLK